MSFEIQELPDVIRIIVLLNLSKIRKSTLKNRVNSVCVNYACVEVSELDRALKEMSAEGLIIESDYMVQLTPQGQS